METKRIFISQPMNGLSDEEIKTEREKIFDTVRMVYQQYYQLSDTEFDARFKLELIDSFIPDSPNSKPGILVNFDALWYLGRSLQFMSQADVVYFGPGWDTARGCKIEHECCVRYMQNCTPAGQPNGEAINKVDCIVEHAGRIIFTPASTVIEHLPFV